MKRKFLCLCLTIVLLSASFTPGRCAAAVNPDDYICLPVLMYHSVKPGGVGKDSITPQEFEKDLKFLRDSGYTSITVSDLLNFVDGAATLPAKPIMLTFDDGFYNNYKYVYPLLKEYDMRIVMSIIAHATDKFTRRPSKSESYSHITWGQLNEMISSGHVEVQNHTFDMHSNKTGRVGCTQKKGESFEDYKKALCDDLIKAQVLICELTGKLPTSYAYPYGKYNDNTVTVLKECGFRASFSCNFGINLISFEGETDLFSMYRICRAHNQSAEKVICDAMETLKFRTAPTFAPNTTTES